MTEPGNRHDDDVAKGELLEEIFLAWLGRCRDGTGEEPEQLIADQAPELQPGLQALIDDYLAVERGKVVGPSFGAGARLGDYRLIRRLGAGSAGTVWEAQQLSLGRRVALKILHPVYGLSDRFLRRFQREAEAAGRIDHPAIVRVYAVGETDGLHYIAQELVPGARTLADAIDDARRRGAMAPEDYRRTALLFSQIADGLQAAHEAGVIHRDLKPGNILLTERGRPRIVDFGLARVAGDEALSRTGELLGTPFYMSPEQIEPRGRTLDARADVFSIGVVLYEALTGRRPFDGDTESLVTRKILTEDPREPARVRSRVPLDLSRICMKALDRTRRRRYGSMAELAEDLKRYLRMEPVQARSPGHVLRLGRWVQRRRRLVLVASLGAVVIALTLKAAYDQQRVAAMTESVGAIGLLSAEGGFGVESVELEAENLSRVRKLLAEYGGLGEVEDAWLTFHTARAWLRAHQPAKALTALEGTLEKESSDSEVRRALLALLALTLASRRSETEVKSYGERYPMMLQALEDQIDNGSTLAARLEAHVAKAEFCYLMRRFNDAELHAAKAVEGFSGLDTRTSFRARLTLAAAAAKNSEIKSWSETVGELETLLEDCLHYESVYELELPETLVCLWHLGWANLEDHEYEPAEKFYKLALEGGPDRRGMSDRFGPEHPDTLVVMTNVGILLYRRGAAEEAEPLLREALAAKRRTVGAEEITTLIGMRALAECLVTQRRWPEAIGLLEDAARVHAEEYGGADVETYNAYNTLAFALYAAGRLGRAEEVSNKALAECAFQGELGSARRADLQLRLAEMRLERGGPDLRRAIEDLKEFVATDPASDRQQWARLILARAYVLEGRTDEAEAWRSQASVSEDWYMSMLDKEIEALLARGRGDESAFEEMRSGVYGVIEERKSFPRYEERILERRLGR